ncbi:putative caffeoylshikimate esterase-like [Capsicum annuum]|nr:putative caffeoylshikimate esterase-like [Capsicum annuum]
MANGFSFCLLQYTKQRTIAKELERQRLKAMQSKKAHKSGVFMIEEFWLNKEGCPFGTVPIRKIAKKQLQSAGDASSSLAYEYFGYKWIDTEYVDYHLVMPVMNEEIGMWPYEVFNRLSANAANLVQYGGKVYTPAGEDISLPMGNGQFRGGQRYLTSYMRKVLYEIQVDGHKEQVPPDDSKVGSKL